MRPTQPSEVVGRVITRIVIQVSDGQTCRDLQATHGAAFEGVVFFQDPPGFGLVATFLSISFHTDPRLSASLYNFPAQHIGGQLRRH